MTRYFKVKGLLIIAAVFIILFMPTMYSVANASPVVSEYPIPTSNAQPYGITTGPDGNLWFTEFTSSANKIGRITPTGTITEFSIGTFGHQAVEIATASDGALWFTENPGNNIGRITTSGAITEYPIPTANSYPWGITSGPDGSLWFVEGGSNKIGRITTSGTITEYSIPSANSNPIDITTGRDGALWFTESNYSHRLGRITTSGTITEYSIYQLSGRFGGITTGSDGALWFTESTNRIGRYTTDGTMTDYSIPSNNPSPNYITAGPDGALWFTEPGSNQIGRITTAGTVTSYNVPTSQSAPSVITSGPDGALWFTENSSDNIGRITTLVPSAPTNLTTSSPAQYPSLTWNTVSDATSYNIYRNGTNIGSSTTASFTDNTAPEGTDTYYVTAVNSGGESSPSNNVNVLVDRTPPTISYSVSPAPNTNGWNNSNVSVTFTCSDSGSGISYCTAPVTLSNEGSNWTVTGTAIDKAGNSASVTTSAISIDKTAPILGMPSWTTNPMTTTQSTIVSVPVSDNLSGVAAGEYYLGTTDPGQGNGTAMTYSGGNLSASFSNMAAGIYTINFRAEDNAGNWSPVTTDYLVVYNAVQSSADGHSNKVVPVYGTDVLPGLTTSGQTDAATMAFTVKYNNGTLDSSSKVHFAYNTGTNCNNPNKATNCHTTTLDSTSIDWMVGSGTNNSQATIQGTATVVIDGVTSINPFRVVATDGALVNPTTSDQFQIQIFAPNANPNSAQPVYYMSEPLSNGNVVVKG